MNIVKKYILLFASLAAMSMMSCVNEGLEDSPVTAAGKIAAIDAQIVSLEASVEDLNALKAASESHGAEIDATVKSLENHIACLKAGRTDLLNGTIATFRQQKELASLVGIVEACDTDGKLSKYVSAVDEGAVSWVGEHFGSYYLAVKAETVVKTWFSGVNLKTQRISVDGLLSDIEAGLRKEIDSKDIMALSASIGENEKLADELITRLSELIVEIGEIYSQNVEAAVTCSEDFDLPALRQLNKSAATTLSEVDDSFEGLKARIETCMMQLQEIRERLDALDETIADLEKLLDMIQSVTFLSEYSAENAVAYYTLGTESRADGKKVRNASGTIDLNYIVRPASAASALTVQDLWNDEIKVFGYYAQTITKATPEMVDFAVSNVTADDSGSGIVTVTVSAAALKEDFYFKETGAKLALSITTDKTDLTSKFVEIVPKDRSDIVYVESIELSSKSIEIDHGTKADLDAFITPDNVTVGGVTWTTSNANVVNVTENGVVEGMSVGSAVITATTKGTDEWGNTIQAQCNVKVNPAIKLSGPSYVEAKGNITIRIESPDYIDPESVTWKSSAPTLAAITKTDDGNALISGEAMYFNTTDKAYAPITITCDIDGKATLYHEIRVIAVQPKGIAIEGLSSGQNALTLKKGQEYTFKSTVQPAEVDMTLFRFRYQSNNTGVVNVPDISSGKVVANTIGSATVSVKVTDQGQYNYFYPARNEYVRYVDVTVEPYWVTGITLPSTWNMKPGDEGSITADFTSDGGENVQPTDMTLSWTSDNSSVVEVDAVTGKMTAKSIGTARITATSTSVPSGSQPVSASCVVTVKEASAADPKVGDYYYSDGTWSTERDAGKTVIGIVFSTLNATGDDSKLREDYPACTNGLVVCKLELTSKYGSLQHQDNYTTGSFPDYIQDNWGEANIIEDKANGYTATLALKGYRTWRGGTSEYVQIIDVLTDQTLPVAPTGTSGWYIPSYAEMLMMNESTINASLGAVGTQISLDNYWTSSLRLSIYTSGLNTYRDVIMTPVNMNEKAWGISYTGNEPECKVRVVLAF